MEPLQPLIDTGHARGARPGRQPSPPEPQPRAPRRGGGAAAGAGGAEAAAGDASGFGGSGRKLFPRGGGGRYTVLVQIPVFGWDW